MGGFDEGGLNDACPECRPGCLLLLPSLTNTGTHIRHDVLGGVDEGGLAPVQHVVQHAHLDVAVEDACLVAVLSEEGVRHVLHLLVHQLGELVPVLSAHHLFQAAQISQLLRVKQTRSVPLRRPILFVEDGFPMQGL